MRKLKQKHPKPIRRYVSIDLFDTDVVLLICDWEDVIEQATSLVVGPKLEKLKELHAKHGKDPYADGLTFNFDGGGSVIWAPHKSTFDVLVHEAFHATVNLLKERATPLVPETEEAYAYVLGYIVRELIKKK